MYMSEYTPWVYLTHCVFYKNKQKVKNPTNKMIVKMLRYYVKSVKKLNYMG